MSDPFVVYLLCITKSERKGIGVAFIVFNSIIVSGVSQISAKETSICFPVRLLVTLKVQNGTFKHGSRSIVGGRSWQQKPMQDGLA